MPNYQAGAAPNAKARSSIARFNCVSIDTDTSTSDTVVLMANGLAGSVNSEHSKKALFDVCEYLTKKSPRAAKARPN
jgi:glutamate N-acetyltransferase/amino-acid N-acetyltransferase